MLVIDDEEPMRFLMEQILGELGYTVLSAARPAEALERISPRSDEIQLIVTDAIMPGTGFRRVFKHLKARTPSLKVLYISGYSVDPKTQGLTGGAFLAKPFSPATLARKVRKVLDS